MPTQHLQLIDSTPAASMAVPSLKIAVATNDLRTVDAHFGSARRFAIYDITPASSRFIEAVSFEEFSDQSSSHSHDGADRIAPKVAALAGCHLLFILAIGGPAAARVVNAHVHPVKLPAEETIDSVLGRVQAMMTGNPPPWLRKVMLSGRGERSMDFLEEEG